MFYNDKEFNAAADKIKDICKRHAQHIIDDNDSYQALVDTLDRSDLVGLLYSFALDLTFTKEHVAYLQEQNELLRKDCKRLSTDTQAMCKEVNDLLKML